MTKNELIAIELYMKEQRVAYWESHHKLPGCKEMVDYFDDRLVIV
ncbi:MAG: hypothetical protein WC916_00015 [Candidatus Woesearchaeota archaeon]